MTLFDPDEATAPPAGPTTRVRMVVAYDGRGFHGFATNPGVRTVAGTIEEALARVTGHKVSLVCAGRTDAGVHAWGQVIHVDVPGEPENVDPERLARSVTKMLKPQIVVRLADLAPAGFHARFSALARHYRYTIVNRPVPDPFLAGLAWHVDQPLDLTVMTLACDPLFGEHDFTSFCKKPPEGQEASLVRRVLDARWHDLGDGVLRFDISATAFCHQMVRTIVGTLVDVGLGKKTAGDIAWILRSRDRANAGPAAPPYGLVLWQVDYPPDHELSGSGAP